MEKSGSGIFVRFHDSLYKALAEGFPKAPHMSDIRPVLGRAEALCTYALRTAYDPQETLCALMRSPFTRGDIGSAVIRKGIIVISISDALLSRGVRETGGLVSLPEAFVPKDDVGYALMRLVMLARRSSGETSLSEGERHMLWTAFSIPDAHSETVLRLRMETASRLAMELMRGRGLSPYAADAAARLIGMGYCVK